MHFIYISIIVVLLIIILINQKDIKPDVSIPKPIPIPKTRKLEDVVSGEIIKIKISSFRYSEDGIVDAVCLNNSVSDSKMYLLVKRTRYNDVEEVEKYTSDVFKNFTTLNPHKITPEQEIKEKLNDLLL